MAFITTSSGMRINVDAIETYGRGTQGGQAMTGIVYRGWGRNDEPQWLLETPEEIDALIAAANEREVREYHELVDALVAEDEERRERDKWGKESMEGNELCTADTP